MDANNGSKVKETKPNANKILDDNKITQETSEYTLSEDETDGKIPDDQISESTGPELTVNDSENLKGGNLGVYQHSFNDTQRITYGYTDEKDKNDSKNGLLFNQYDFNVSDDENTDVFETGRQSESMPVNVIPEEDEDINTTSTQFNNISEYTSRGSDDTIPNTEFGYTTTVNSDYEYSENRAANNSSDETREPNEYPSDHSKLYEETSLNETADFTSDSVISPDTIRDVNELPELKSTASNTSVVLNSDASNSSESDKLDESNMPLDLLLRELEEEFSSENKELETAREIYNKSEDSNTSIKNVKRSQIPHWPESAGPRPSLITHISRMETNNQSINDAIDIMVNPERKLNAVKEERDVVNEISNTTQIPLSNTQRNTTILKPPRTERKSSKVVGKTADPEIASNSDKYSWNFYTVLAVISGVAVLVIITRM
ncbi:hypothetical protein RF11_11715 [Thelohanellus kitauei]|uniref:Uncharacterized protein n=1 Tax=Thelohanellus kitauei TaxID=669202 RepID=A0A0C2JTR4_THEKT|nr:hypothetical protein RF11_11715 [Thelohanellus kitauei]